MPDSRIFLDINDDVTSASRRSTTSCDPHQAVQTQSWMQSCRHRSPTEARTTMSSTAGVQSASLGQLDRLLDRRAKVARALVPAAGEGRVGVLRSRSASSPRRASIVPRSTTQALWTHNKTSDGVDMAVSRNNFIKREDFLEPPPRSSLSMPSSSRSPGPKTFKKRAITRRRRSNQPDTRR